MSVRKEPFLSFGAFLRSFLFHFHFASTSSLLLYSRSRRVLLCRAERESVMRRVAWSSRWRESSLLCVVETRKEQQKQPHFSSSSLFPQPVTSPPLLFSLPASSSSLLHLCVSAVPLFSSPSPPPRKMRALFTLILPPFSLSLPPPPPPTSHISWAIWYLIFTPFLFFPPRK